MLLPADKARHVGEAVAMVVAETEEQALDAAEAVQIDYDELPFVTDGRAALEPGAPAVWDEVPGNCFIDTMFGDVEATDRAFAAADHVVKMDFHIGRVTAVTMEPRAALGVFDPDSGRYSLHAGSGGAVRQKHEIAYVLGVAPSQLRVQSYDVGGNFGSKNRPYVEYGLVLWASRKVGRPVKYTATRSETFLSDYQGRDLVTSVELALDRGGRFLALRADNISNVGARCVSLSPLSKGAGLITGSYDIPAATLRARAVFTNTMMTQAYRSSGRPEVNYAIERLVDTAARELGFDRVELRRTNFVRPEAMPYTNAVGMVYDSGTYEANMDAVMRLADWDGFPARKREAASRGKLLGLGMGHYVESSIGSPKERAEITVTPDGRVDMVIGTQPSGQGHETSFAQVLADMICVPVECINVIMGDTDIVSVGGGSHSGRSMRHAGTVIAKASTELVARGKAIAAVVAGTAADQVEFKDGRFRVPGTNYAFDFLELARQAAQHTCPTSSRTVSRSRPTTRCTSRFSRTAAPCARSRSIRKRARSPSPATPRSTMSAAASIRSSCTGRRMAASRRASARRCGNSSASTPRDSRSPPRSWITACRASTTCRRSGPRSPRCCRRPIRSASRPAAKAAPRRPSR